jgi:RNA polymerase sigma-70 factor (ECF subfamily)
MGKLDASAARYAGSASVEQNARDCIWAQYILAMRTGDERGLVSLYEESCTLLHAIARRILGNSADAEEAVSDVYCQIWRGARTWDPVRGSPSAWLAMLCRSRCIDRIRARGVASHLEVSLGQEVVHQLCGKPSAVDRSLRLQVLRRAMEALDQRQSQIVRMAFFTGLTHAEIAAELSLPLGTVKGRIRNAVRRLRSQLQGFPI